MKQYFSVMSQLWKYFSGAGNLQNDDVNIVLTQLAFTCSKLTIETLEQDVKYV